MELNIGSVVTINTGRKGIIRAKTSDRVRILMLDTGNVYVTELVNIIAEEPPLETLDIVAGNYYKFNPEYIANGYQPSQGLPTSLTTSNILKALESVSGHDTLTAKFTWAGAGTQAWFVAIFELVVAAPEDIALYQAQEAVQEARRIAIEEERIRLQEQEERRKREAEAKKLEEERLKKLALEAKATELKDILLNIYPDAHIVYHDTNVDDCISKSTYPHAIYIRFDSLVVSNSNGLSTPIYGLWVKLGFNNDLRFSNNMAGLRDTMSSKELSVHYQHSHLPGYSPEHFIKFCLGSGPINGVLNLLSRDFDAQQFEILLFMLQTYLQWESLEGVPHIKMAQISASGSRDIPNLNHSICQANYEKFLATFDNFPVSLVGSESKEFVVSDTDEAFIEMVTSIATHKLYRVPGTATYFTNKNGDTVSEDRLRGLNNDNRNRLSFKLDGEQIPFTVIAPSNQNSNLVEVAHKDIIRYIANKLSVDLTDFVITAQTKEKLTQ